MKYLIFGGTGSLGKKLISRFLANGDQVGVFSRDEAKHWTIKNDLSQSNSVDFFVGDVRDSQRVREIIVQYRPETIIIAAALKQVDTCELSPSESINTNLIGTQNIINAVNSSACFWNDEWYVKNVCFVSTDKACSPVNVYGMCKSLSERVVTSQARIDNQKTKFVCTRYGNVLESRGSIIPLLKHQAENSNCLTVTNPEMTRFVMTLDESVDLILNAITLGKSGETWIPKLPAMKIGDLAEIFSEIYDKPIKIIGIRPGEKMHEDLINESESIRTFESNGHYVIKPAYATGEGHNFEYTSADDVLSKTELKKHLEKLGIIDMPLSKFQGLKIEEIKTR